MPGATLGKHCQLPHSLRCERGSRCARGAASGRMLWTKRCTSRTTRSSRRERTAPAAQADHEGMSLQAYCGTRGPSPSRLQNACRQWVAEGVARPAGAPLEPPPSRTSSVGRSEQTSGAPKSRRRDRRLAHDCHAARVERGIICVRQRLGRDQHRTSAAEGSRVLARTGEPRAPTLHLALPNRLVLRLDRPTRVTPEHGPRPPQPQGNHACRISIAPEQRGSADPPQSHGLPEQAGHSAPPATSRPPRRPSPLG